MSGVEWVNDVVGHPVGAELTRLEAEQVTAKIKGYVGVAWVLLYEAHERKAHKALGYGSWAEYVAAEFDIGKSHSYRLIAQARVVMEISEAAGVSPMGDIPERTARDLIDHDAVEEASIAAADAVSTMVDTASEAEKAKAAADAAEQVRFDAVQRARARREAEAAEKAAAELEGRNADGEVLNPGSEPREGEGGSDGEGAADDEGVGGRDPEPPAPSNLKGAAHPDDSYRARMSTEFAKVRNGLFLLSPDRMLEVSDLERRGDIEALCVDLRAWCEDVERVFVNRPRMEAVK